MFTQVLAPGWRLVVLDSYHEAVIGLDENDPHEAERKKRGEATLRAGERQVVVYGVHVGENGVMLGLRLNA